MATIKTLIERVETRLFMLSGLDVQIHAEGQIEEMLRGAYNMLFDDFWHPDHTLYDSKELDGKTGQITDDLTNIVRRYKDLHTVYWNEDEDPLPRITPGTSLSRVRSRSIMPSGNPRTVFKIAPVNTMGNVHFWYRTKIADDVWRNQLYDTEINIDDEVLLLSVVHEWLVNDDSNQVAIEEYRNKFIERKQQMRDAQWQAPLSKRKLERDGPLTRWE